MRSIYLLVEGYTELAVVDAIIQPHLEQVGFHVRKSIIITKRSGGTSAMRGGLASWSKFAAEIGRVLKDPTIDVLTTVVDYYGIPHDIPGMATRRGVDPYPRVAHVEKELSRGIGDSRFIANLVLHELEAWVLAAAAQLGENVGRPALAGRLQGIVARSGGPELVNDGPTSAPSKRIGQEYPAFNKVSDGPQAIADLGLVELRSLCPHADSWLSRLEKLA